MEDFDGIPVVNVEDNKWQGKEVDVDSDAAQFEPAMHAFNKRHKESGALAPGFPVEGK